MKIIFSIPVKDSFSTNLSEDRSLIAIVSEYGYKLTIYDIEKKHKIFTTNSWIEVGGHPTFSEDLTKVAVISLNKIRIKDIPQYFYRYIRYFIFGKYKDFYSFTGDSALKILDIETKKILNEKFFEGNILFSSVFCNKDSELILSSFQYRKTPQEEDGNPVVIWDSKLTAPHYSMFMPRKEDDFYSTVASDRDTVATMGIYNFYLWKLSTKKIFLDLFESKNIDGTSMRAKTHKVRGDSEINCYCFSGDSTSVAIGLHYFSGASQQDNVCIYSIHADKALIKGWYSPYYAKKVALSYTGIYLGVIASYHKKNRFILYNTETKQELFILEDEELTDVHFSKNDEIILCSESSVTIWKIDN